MTITTYSIIKHCFEGQQAFGTRATQTVLFKNLESKELAQRVIKGARDGLKKALRLAKKENDITAYNLLFNTKFSISTHITHLTDKMK